MEKRELPVGWRWKKLIEVCHVVNGTTPMSSINEYWGGDIVWITPTDLGRLQKAEILDSERHITEKGFKSCGLELVPKNTVILSSRAPIGHLGVASVPLCTNQGCKSLVPGEKIDSKFLYFVLKYTISELQRLGSGATFAEVSKSQVENFEIPLPSLAEQQHIAAILTDQLAAVEQARKASEARLEAARALPAAYLREVFENEEAKEWPIIKLGDILEIVQNGIYKPAEYYGSGENFIRMYNIQKDTWHLIINELARVILNENERDKFRLKKDDLLISRVNSHELVGKCGWVDEEAEGCFFENMLIRLRVIDTVDSLFLAQQMATKFVKKQIERIVKRAIGQSSINSSDIRGLSIVLPPYPTQLQVADYLENKIRDVRKLTQAIEDELATLEIFPTSLLRQAFTGNL